MKYVVVSSSKIRGRAIFHLISDFLDSEDGNLLIGKYDMDYLLYENLDLLIFDKKYFDDYKQKIKSKKVNVKKMLLLSFDLARKNFSDLPEFVNLVDGDSTMEELEKVLFFEEETLEDFQLEDRDLSILFLLSGGLTNKEIGSRLYLSEKTIKNNLSRIYKVLGVSNRFEAINLYKKFLRED